MKVHHVIRWDWILDSALPKHVHNSVLIALQTCEGRTVQFINVNGKCCQNRADHYGTTNRTVPSLGR